MTQRDWSRNGADVAPRSGDTNAFFRFVSAETATLRPILTG